MSETTTNLFHQINSSFGSLGEHYLSEKQTEILKMETSFQMYAKLKKMTVLIFQHLKAS